VGETGSTFEAVENMGVMDVVHGQVFMGRFSFEKRDFDSAKLVDVGLAWIVHKSGYFSENCCTPPSSVCRLATLWQATL
jgi:hypothetical protein